MQKRQDKNKYILVILVSSAKDSFQIRETLGAWHISAIKHADNYSKPIPNQYSIL